METPETDRFRQTIRESLKRIDPLMDDDAIDGHSIMVAFDYAVAVLCRHIDEQNQTIAGLNEEIDDDRRRQANMQREINLPYMQIEPF